jgi:hypothetical protein
MGSVRYGGQGGLNDEPMTINKHISTLVLMILPSLDRVNENLRT